MAAEHQHQPVTVLAMGDSLTEGYYSYGRKFHPYAKHLTNLFDLAQLPVKITQLGISGDRVVPSMINRFRRHLEKSPPYDWIIILGGTNDLFDPKSAKEIFQSGLQPMYELALQNAKTRLMVMTVFETAIHAPQNPHDAERQALNTMIRDYVANTKHSDRVYLVDLDRQIPYHSITDAAARDQIWDDGVHLTPDGYDRMATLIFETMRIKL